MFIFGLSASPPVRAAIAIVLIVVGIALHRYVLDVTGAVLLVVAGWQFASRRRRGTGNSR
jgi:hypothetical protein